MTTEQSLLWDKIYRFELDDPQAAFSFSDRLAQENGWPLAFSLRAILEYKRFMYLVCIAERPLTPSDEVDQVWHLHLLYTDSYWNQFCKNVLGREIHHGPTKGGQQEAQKFVEWYEATKHLYRAFFKMEPPPDLWPSAEARFRPMQFQRVPLHKFWLIPKLF